MDSEEVAKIAERDAVDPLLSVPHWLRSHVNKAQCQNQGIDIDRQCVYSST